MSNTGHTELAKILTVVESALSNHTRWHDDLIRRLLCRLPLPDSVTEKDAHRCCEFGVWFYGSGKLHAGNLPAFNRIGELHKSMHDSAREVCQKTRATGYAPETDYDSFERNLKQFRDELHNFKSRVMATLETVQARHPD